MTLADLQKKWQDTPEYHSYINDLFTELVNKDDQLREHRDWVQSNIFGFGEKSFWYLWQIICDELPTDAKMLEIGVFKGATISLWQLLKPLSNVWGVSPMNGAGTGWTEDNYWGHVNTIYDKFNSILPHDKFPIIIEGYSDNVNTIEIVKSIGEFDLIYVDGGHSYETALSDLTNYSQMIKQGGYLVIDDCNCDMNLPPTGYFTGIAEVTNAKKDWLATNPLFQFVCSVVHISVFKRI
jgi:hypothetical protein